MNAVIRYPGAKWRIAQWVIEHFPEHRTYLEPYFGSGAVLFNKPRSLIETVNDLDGDVVNFFRWIRDDPEKLSHEIYFTPYAREEFDRAFNEQNTETNSFQRAVNFCIRLTMGYGFRTNGNRVGWKCDIHGREAAYSARDWCRKPELIMQAAERLRGVQIENLPAVELIEKHNFPNVLIYADPPYLLQTRSGKQYKKEMTDDDHEEMLTALKKHKGPVVISGYESELYNEKLSGWHTEKISNQTQSNRQKEEVIWMNFEPDITFFEIGGS